ncbi:MAG: DUF3782 domain-containing protein [Magnetococcales bacterium]|nr:DUF3782 domain-containing protein [Magnetococcales bacterium]MBF0156224.1 DUF3782 domain-containing protein [Magnetococcales bacterium]
MFQEMVRENRERSAELDRKFQETSAQMKETDRRIQETDRQIQETGAQLRETDRQVKETGAQLKETDRQVKETGAQLRETDLKVKEVSTQIGRLGGRWGEFVEGLVAPACETLFAERGIPVHKVSRRVKAKRPGNRHMEIDLLVVNTDAVVLVEVKSRLTEGDVREHLTRLAEFKDFFQEYAGMRVMGAVAGIVIEENVERFAVNEGLFVMVQSGEVLRFANDGEFQPRVW